MDLDCFALLVDSNKVETQQHSRICHGMMTVYNRAMAALVLAQSKTLGEL